MTSSATSLSTALKTIEVNPEESSNKKKSRKREDCHHCDKYKVQAPEIEDLVEDNMRTMKTLPSTIWKEYVCSRRASARVVNMS